MKRFVKIFISFILVFIVLTPITSFAAEVAETGGGSYNTIFTRLWEFVSDNKAEVVSAAGSLLLLIASGIVKALNSKEAKKLKESLTVIEGTTSNTTKAQGSIITVVNKMIDAVNLLAERVDKMYKAYEENQTIENDRNRLLGAIMVQVTAILEMQSAVYVHNKNLPQGVKDLTILKYANAQKALNDDEILCAIVESVREKVNFEEPVELPSEEVSEEEAVI